MGFVSNSSSSSFVIFFKGNLEDEVKKAFGAIDVGPNYPIKNFNFNVADTFMRCVEDPEGISLQELKDEYCYDEDDEYYQNIKGMMNKGFKAAMVTFEDEHDDELESMLCNSDIEYVSDTLVMHNEGGY
jgi:hypothetical protein